MHHLLTFIRRSLFLLFFISCTSNATTYNFSQSFSGVWSAAFGDPNTTFTHSADFPALPSLNITNETTVAVIPNNNIGTCISCTGTDTISNGDKFFTTFTLDAGVVALNSATGLFDNTFSGTYTVTGGSGLFTDATGSGTFSLVDFGVGSFVNTNFIFNNSGKFEGQSSFTINTPVPEPESYAMMMAGLGVMGFVGRRRKKQVN